MVETPREAKNTEHFCWQENSEKLPQPTRKHERGTPPSTESEMTPKRPNLHGDGLILEENTEGNLFFDEEMADENPQDPWDLWGSQVDDALNNLFERMHALEANLQGEQNARIESLQGLKAEFEHAFDKFLTTEHWNVMQAKFMHMEAKITSNMQEHESSLQDMIHQQIASASQSMESHVTEINQKLDHVVETSQKLLLQKFMNGMSDMESRVMVHIQSKFTPIETLAQGTHENLHDMRFRLVRLEGNVIRGGTLL